MDLDTGVHLRTSKIRTFDLLDYLTHALRSLTWSHGILLGIDFPSHQGHCCWSMKVRQKIKPVPTVLLLPLTTTRGYWPGSLAVSQYLCPCSYPISGCFPTSRIFTTSFLGPLLPKIIFFWEPFFSALLLCSILRPWFFSSLNSLCVWQSRHIAWPAT